MSINVFIILLATYQNIYESSFSAHLIMILKMQSQETHPVMFSSFPMKNLRQISS